MLKKGLRKGSPRIGMHKVKLYLLTSNKGKVEEIARVAVKYGVELETVDAPKLEVQSDSLREIALYSAINYYVSSGGMPVLTEDAGLFIRALNGFPGPYSSYVYRTLGVKGVLKLMDGVEDREAYFESAVAIVYDGLIVAETARVNGLISKEARGEGGFGFDPIFIPHGFTRTFAEMSIDEKNSISHRAKAVAKALESLLNLLKI